MPYMMPADMHELEEIYPQRRKKKKKKLLSAATKKKLLNFYGGRDPSDERIKANLSKIFDPNQPRDPHTGRWVDTIPATSRAKRGLLAELDEQGHPKEAPIRSVVGNVRGTHKAIARDADGNIVGAIDYSISRSAKQISIHDVRVTLQRQGVGQELLKQIAHSVADLPGADKYSMDVYGAVLSAVAWYRKTGADFVSWSHAGTWSPEKVKILRKGKMPPPGVIRDHDGNIVNHIGGYDVDEYARKIAKTRRGFDPNQPRNPNTGEWTDVFPGVGAPTGVEPVRATSPRTRRKSGGRAKTSTAQAKALPRIPGTTEKNRALEQAKNYSKAEQNYAGLIIRIAGKGKTQNPEQRGKMSAKYGIPANRLIAIENEMVDAMFPPKVGRRQSRSLAAQDVTAPLRQAIDQHGARSAISLPGGGKLFKATKGEYRGQMVELLRNGAFLRVVPKRSEAKAIRDAQRFEKEEKERRKNRSFAAQQRRATELAQERQMLADQETASKQTVARKVARAKQWATENGFDPSDSYWWALYWRDPSLLKRDDETTTVPTRVNLPTARQRRKAKSPEVLDLPDISSRRMRGYRPGPRKRQHGDVGKVFYEFTKWDFDPNQPRDYHGRWTDTGFGGPKAIGRRAKSGFVPEHHTLTGGGSRGLRVAVGGGKFDLRTKSLAPGVKLTRLPHNGVHAPLGPNGKPLAKKKYSPEEALFLRNNGGTKISDKRLAEIHADRSKVTQQEFDLLMSAGAQAHLDGESGVRVWVVRTKEFKQRPRFSIIANLRKELANDKFKETGSGSRGSGGHVVRRHDISAAKKEAENKKRVTSGRNAYAKIRKEMAEFYSVDAKGNQICIFCGRKVAAAESSPERMKPGPLGGKYEHGNVAPSHERCNTRMGTYAQNQPAEYYEEMMLKFMALYKKMPLDKQKKLQVVFNKNRARLGARPK